MKLHAVFAVYMVATIVGYGDYAQASTPSPNQEKRCSDEELDDALTAFLRCDPHDAFKHAMVQAKNGNAYSLYILGAIYESGGRSYGLPEIRRNQSLAERYYLVAAKRGNAEAQFGIGFIYVKHNAGSPGRAKLGRYWMCKAAEQGQNEAIVNINNYAGEWKDYCSSLIDEIEVNKG